jgi:hypothetical protein
MPINRSISKSTHPLAAGPGNQAGQAATRLGEQQIRSLSAIFPQPVHRTRIIHAKAVNSLRKT